MAEQATSEQQLASLERQLAELERESPGDDRVQQQINDLKGQVGALRQELAAGQPRAWQRVELARHPRRPYTLDYISLLFENFSQLHGDRTFGDDPAIICGMARFHGEPVLVVGHQKGRDTKERLARNFGQPKPEGYRKALRAMRLAAKFRRPIFTLVDTQGAYPGVDAEARGQAAAIAHNLREIARLPVPIVVTVTGEGGSGGALAIAIGDKINMLENAFYSVISPEGCASIMWRDAGQKERAAEALRITAEDLLALGLIDDIIPEPAGGAHRNHKEMAKILDTALERSLAELRAYSSKELLARRYEKFRRMGQFFRMA
ncbi:MAG: acetyl-CoA carboxylase carboxyltransferase subunit alpha [Terriglobia bacterium]